VKKKKALTKMSLFFFVFRMFLAAATIEARFLDVTTSLVSPAPPGVHVLKLFSLSRILWTNKLEHLFLESFSRPV
jgi:hypothetical protein